MRLAAMRQSGSPSRGVGIQWALNSIPYDLKAAEGDSKQTTGLCLYRKVRQDHSIANTVVVTQSTT